MNGIVERQRPMFVFFPAKEKAEQTGFVLSVYTAMCQLFDSGIRSSDLSSVFLTLLFSDIACRLL